MAVHSSRVAVFGTCAVLTALSVLVPQLATGPALVAVLLVVGFACLGLFPNYYSFSQELSAAHQGKVSGALGCINWLVMALLHEVVGDTVKRTGSYTVVMSAAGLVPLLGLVVLLLFWGPAPSAEPALAAKLVPSSGDAPGPTSDRPPVDADTPASAEPTPARVG
jgi:hypothetical protein